MGSALSSVPFLFRNKAFPLAKVSPLQAVTYEIRYLLLKNLQ